MIRDKSVQALVLDSPSGLAVDRRARGGQGKTTSSIMRAVGRAWGGKPAGGHGWGQSALLATIWTLVVMVVVPLGALVSPASAEAGWADMTTEWKTMSAFDETARPASAPPRPASWKMPASGSELARLHSLISYDESWQDQYDARHLAAVRQPPKKPTAMTIAEIFVWIKATPGQHHAIGRYQIIPDTLARLVRETGISPATRFRPAVQDMFANTLIAEAGCADFKSGALSLPRFMDGLALIWAGLPRADGYSAYHGRSGEWPLFTPGLTSGFGIRQIAVQAADSARVTASGSRSITESRISAARSGDRRACSQSLIVPTGSPKRAANPACDNFSFLGVELG